MEYWIAGWTVPKQEVTEAVRETWMWESGKDECVHTSEGPETAYRRGTEFSRMGCYDFPGQIAGHDGSEGNWSMGAGVIVLENSTSTGSIRVDRTDPVAVELSGHELDEGGNGGHTRSSDRGKGEREFSSNGG